MTIFAVVDRWADSLGKLQIRFFEQLGQLFQFSIETCKNVPAAFRDFRFIMEQMNVIGISSLPLVAVTSVFTGAVAAWQAAYQFADYVPLRYIGTAVEKTVFLELGPVLTALVVAGRVGAAMTAELGTMAVTEQLDAMKVLGLNPYRYFLAPRLISGLVMLPVLTIFSCTVAVLGAFGVVWFFKGLPASSFFGGVRVFYSHLDVIVGLTKALAFGGIISLFGTFFGYNCTHGAEGVGRATRASVVASMVSILVASFLISHLLLN